MTTIHMKATKELFLKYWELKREDNSWDYKRELNLETKSGKFNLIKDFIAFANYGGGFLLLGVDDNDFSLHNQIRIDQAKIGDILDNNLGFNIEFEITYFEEQHNNNCLNLGIIYIHPSKKIIVCPKHFQSERQTTIIAINDIITRRNTKSTKADADDFEKINSRIANYRNQKQSDESLSAKPTIYKTNKQRLDALWNTIDNKYEFSAEQVAIKIRQILYYSEHNKIDFANLIGINLDSFEEILNGNVIPELNALIRISKIFNVKLDFFFLNDYYGRRQFWKEDLVWLSIVHRINPIEDIGMLENSDYVMGRIVYETAKNIQSFYDLIRTGKIEYTRDTKMKKYSDALDSIDAIGRKNILGELAHQHYKILEQVRSDVEDKGLTNVEKIISTWYSYSSAYLARIFVESIKEIKILDKDKFEISYHFWQEILDKEVRGRSYNNKELKMEFGETRFKV